MKWMERDSQLYESLKPTPGCVLPFKSSNCNFKQFPKSPQILYAVLMKWWHTSSQRMDFTLTIHAAKRFLHWNQHIECVPRREKCCVGGLGALHNRRTDPTKDLRNYVNLVEMEKRASHETIKRQYLVDKNLLADSQFKPEGSFPFPRGSDCSVGCSLSWEARHTMPIQHHPKLVIKPHVIEQQKICEVGTPPPLLTTFCFDPVGIVDLIFSGFWSPDKGVKVFRDFWHSQTSTRLPGTSTDRPEASRYHRDGMWASRCLSCTTPPHQFSFSGRTPEPPSPVALICRWNSRLRQQPAVHQYWRLSSGPFCLSRCDGAPTPASRLADPGPRWSLGASPEWRGSATAVPNINEETKHPRTVLQNLTSRSCTSCFYLDVKWQCNTTKGGSTCKDKSGIVPWGWGKAALPLKEKHCCLWCAFRDTGIIFHSEMSGSTSMARTTVDSTRSNTCDCSQWKILRFDCLCCFFHKVWDTNLCQQYREARPMDTKPQGRGECRFWQRGVCVCVCVCAAGQPSVEILHKNLCSEPLCTWREGNERGAKLFSLNRVGVDLQRPWIPLSETPPAEATRPWRPLDRPPT